MIRYFRHYFSMLSLSAVSLLTYMTIFTLTTNSFSRLVGVAETWFDLHVPDSSLNVQSYCILHFDMLTHDGGDMLLIDNCFHMIDCKQYSFGHIQILRADVL